MAGIENAALAGAAWATTLAAAITVVTMVTRRGTPGWFLPVLTLFLTALFLALVMAAGASGAWIAVGGLALATSALSVTMTLAGRPSASALGFAAVVVVLGAIGVWGVCTGRLAFPASR